MYIKKKREKEKHMKKGIIISILVILAALATIGGIWGTKLAKYNKAVATLAELTDNYTTIDYENQIGDVKQDFINLKQFRESETNVTKCDYQLSNYYLSIRDLAKAREGFEALACEDKLVEVTYYEADAMFNDKKYDEAKEVFGSISYEDSADRVKECDYCIALDLLGNKKYDEAKELFNSISYKDSADKAKECDYCMASDLFDEKKFDEAKKIFMNLDDYSDSKNKVNDCDYSVATGLFDDKKYKDALPIYEDLESKEYVDAHVKAGLCKYELGRECLDNGNIDDAGAYFAQIVEDGDIICAISPDLRASEADNFEIFDPITENSTNCCYMVNYLMNWDQSSDGTLTLFSVYYRDSSDEMTSFAYVDFKNEYRQQNGKMIKNVILEFAPDGKRINRSSHFLPYYSYSADFEPPEFLK